MKAAVYEKYGPPDVVKVRELPTPVPNDNEVLIQVRAATVSSGDWRIRSLDVPKGFGLLSRAMFGVFKPRQPILGTECAGDVVAVGKAVTRFKIGDAVFAFRGAAMGCHAEFVCMREDGLLEPKPDNLSYEQAAALSFGGSAAQDFLRRAGLSAGETVLINGASGTVGLAAVQLAKYYGAHVTAVCSDANRALVRSLGADQVIDYRAEDFTAGAEQYDVIMDTAGTAPYSRSKKSLKPDGRFLMVNGGMPDMLRSAWVGLTGQQKIIAGPAAERAEDIQLLARLAAQNKFKPVIDCCFPLNDIVEAHRYVDTGHKKGSVVIRFAAL